MLRISNVKMPADFNQSELEEKIAALLGVKAGELRDFSLLKLSVDARRKSDVHYVCSAAFSAENERRLLESGRNVNAYEPTEYKCPTLTKKPPLRPVVVGMGPAGLFAALTLAAAGAAPIILERGKKVEDRTADVERFWSTGVLDTASNVQFGEGGAGTFSDGKLYTGVSDGRISHVLQTLVRHGAAEDILWSAKPHVGTDVLRSVLLSIRRELTALGCDIRFESALTGLIVKNGALSGVKVSSAEGEYELECGAAILAPGHSARDTFAMLCDSGVKMEQKPFAVGLRIEHDQDSISRAQYGDYAALLPPADYKLAVHLPNGRSAYSFCVCPGGQVIAAASEQGRLVTNGMSLRARDGKNINGALLVGVTPADFGGGHPLDGVRFQQRWEEAAYRLGGGDFAAPVQRLSDFLRGRVTESFGAVTPTYLPAVATCDLRACLPDYVSDTIAASVPRLDATLHGYGEGDAVLTGIESRSSSPVRIVRDGTMQSSVRGLFPCGEGAGYAGGITSAAVDGIKCAEAYAAVCQRD